MASTKKTTKATKATKTTKATKATAGAKARAPAKAPAGPKAKKSAGAKAKDVVQAGPRPKADAGGRAAAKAAATGFDESLRRLTAAHREGHAATATGAKYESKSAPRTALDALARTLFADADPKRLGRLLEKARKVVRKAGEAIGAEEADMAERRAQGKTGGGNAILDRALMCIMA